MAMENGGITPVMPIGNGSDFGGNSFMWIFGLLILLGMFNGGGFGWGNNGFANAIGYENLATSNEVQRGFDNQNLQAQTRDILAAVNAGTAQSVAATNQTFHDTVNALSDKYSELARDIANTQMTVQQSIANENECCCSTKMLIQQAASDNALQMAQMEARLNAKMDANEITALRDKVSSLELAQATNGMLRFPNSWSYGAGPFPPIYGCCNQANI